MSDSTKSLRTGNQARRHAEALAREALAGTLVGTAGNLGVAFGQRDQALTGMTIAEQEAEHVLNEASARAQQLLTAARGQLAAVESEYSAAWRKARAAGWSLSQLRAMGYERPARQRSTRSDQLVSDKRPTNGQQSSSDAELLNNGDCLSAAHASARTEHAPATGGSIAR